MLPTRFGKWVRMRNFLKDCVADTDVSADDNGSSTASSYTGSHALLEQT